jgi:hypothetical protein
VGNQETPHNTEGLPLFTFAEERRFYWFCWFSGVSKRWESKSTSFFLPNNRPKTFYRVFGRFISAVRLRPPDPPYHDKRFPFPEKISHLINPRALCALTYGTTSIFSRGAEEKTINVYLADGH